jgi:hypothetical protein
MEGQSMTTEALRQCRDALRFILAFYEPGQNYLDTEAWKLAEAGGRRAMAAADLALAQPAAQPVALTFERREDGTYDDDHTQRHWWTWQNALASPERPAQQEPVDWHAHGMAWAQADAMEAHNDGEPEWIANDVARAFEAGARAALATAAPPAQTERPAQQEARIVHVCLEKDIECGKHSKNWCGQCPLWAYAEGDAPPYAAPPAAQQEAAHAFHFGPHGLQCKRCGAIWHEADGKPANGQCPSGIQPEAASSEETT